MRGAHIHQPQGIRPLGLEQSDPGQLRGRDVSGWFTHQVWAVVLVVVLMAACERPTTGAPPSRPASGDKAAVQRVAQRANASEPLTVVIEPGHATADTDLTAVSNDVSVTYTWSVNGFPVEDASDRVLPKTRFRRSDTVAVETTLNEQSARAETTIHNAPPYTVEVALDRPLDLLRAGVDLTAMPKGVDPDGDDVTWAYQWIRNDGEMAGESSAVLRGDRYQRGDRITVRVTPSDAFGGGEPYTPTAVTIPNAPPAFVSRPPGLKASPDYLYQVQAVDPDGDQIQYRLVKAPGGMTMDAASGTLRWPLKGTAPGRHAVEIEINDGFGATASQPFELELALPEGS